MTRITQTKLARAVFDQKFNPLTGKLERSERILEFKPAQERDLVTCKGCNRKKLLSIGQIWVCHHKD